MFKRRSIEALHYLRGLSSVEPGQLPPAFRQKKIYVTPHHVIRRRHLDPYEWQTAWAHAEHLEAEWVGSMKTLLMSLDEAFAACTFLRSFSPQQLHSLFLKEFGAYTGKREFYVGTTNIFGIYTKRIDMSNAISAKIKDTDFHLSHATPGHLQRGGPDCIRFCITNGITTFEFIKLLENK